MSRVTIYSSLDDAFETIRVPDWYEEAVQYMRGGADRGRFGLYLYNLLLHEEEINTVVNIGTARGHSAVCCAKALEESGRNGTVYTIDIIEPDQERDWHVPKQPSSDPLREKTVSMRDIISRFWDYDATTVDIEFSTGDSVEVLEQLDEEIDVVFHDGRHTYQTVNEEIALVQDTSSPVHVFDDCYLYPERRDIVGRFPLLERVPKLRGVMRKLRQYKIIKDPFPGVTKAVREVLQDGFDAEVVQDEDHAPITAMFPRG